MSIGLIGPTRGDRNLLRAASEFLLFRHDVARIIYLGSREDAHVTCNEWVQELLGDCDLEKHFLDEAVRSACHGDEKQIRDLLANDEKANRVRDIHTLPDAPRRSVEVIHGNIAIFIQDKSCLDEDDIASSHVVVYGVSDELAIKRFGNRCFFTPGPLEHGHVGILEGTDNDQVTITAYKVNATALWCEQIGKVVPRLSVI